MNWDITRRVPEKWAQTIQDKAQPAAQPKNEATMRKTGTGQAEPSKRDAQFVGTSLD